MIAITTTGQTVPGGLVVDSWGQWDPAGALLFVISNPRSWNNTVVMVDARGKVKHFGVSRSDINVVAVP